jgi:DNA-binding CsgD family transcriptional regulator
LLAAGEITSSMAERLEIRESTVRTHVEKMRDKFGVSTRAALVALGFRLGYLDNVG